MADDAYDDIRDLEQKYLLYQSDAFYEEHGHKSYNNFKSISYDTSVATPGYSPALRVPSSAIPMICRSRYKNVGLFNNMSSLGLSSMTPFAELYLLTTSENGTERLRRVPLGGTKLSRISDASQMTDPSHSIISGAGIEKIRVQKNLVGDNAALNRGETTVDLDISLSNISEIYKFRGRGVPKLSDLTEAQTKCVLYYGWSLPTGAPETDSNVYSGLWRERLRLQTQDYDINIAEDGSVSLKIVMKNISRSAASIKVLDGLVPEERLEAARAERERIRAEIRELENQMTQAGEPLAGMEEAIGNNATSRGVREFAEEEIDRAYEQQQAEREQLQAQIEQLRQNLIPFSGLVYRAFLSSLFESGKVHYADVNKKIGQREFGIEFSTPPVLFNKGFMTNYSEVMLQAAAAAAARRGEDDEEPSDDANDENNGSEDEQSPETNPENEVLRTDDAPRTAETDPEAGEGDEEFVPTERLYSPGENKHRIYYILLGDIIDTALKATSASTDSFVKKLRFALGPINLVDLQAIGGNEGDSNRKDIPLSAIPISLKEFNNWFFNHIINRQKSDITFNVFVQELFADIIHSKLVDGGVDKASGFNLETIQTVPRPGETLEQASVAYPSPPPPQLSVEHFTLPSKKGLLSNNNIRGKYNGKTDFSQLPRRARSLPSATSDYIYIGAHSLKYEYPFLTDRPFNRRSAVPFGIPGLFYGEEKSLVKSLNYKSKMTDDINRVRLQQVLESETQTGDRQLIKFYDAEISLFGNTHFTSGDHFWLEPKNYPHSRNMRRKLINQKIIHPYKALEVINELSHDDFTTTIGRSVFIDANRIQTEINDRRRAAEAARAEFREREAARQQQAESDSALARLEALQEQIRQIEARRTPSAGDLAPGETLPGGVGGDTTSTELSEEDRRQLEILQEEVTQAEAIVAELRARQSDPSEVPQEDTDGETE
jgi:hypothetical protein